LAAKTLAYVDVYVDDFDGAAQGNPSMLKGVRDTLFHTIDQVLRPRGTEDPITRQLPISEKQLGNGDACWATQKVVLGWPVDSVAKTISFTPRRTQGILEILHSLPSTKKCIAVKQCNNIVGELCSMSPVVSGLGGFFILLQESFRHEHQKRIPLSRALHDFLDDIRWIIAYLAHRPTHIAELIPTGNTTVVAHDASIQGMGGVIQLPQPHGTHQP
jgi:hypothetical protein